MIEKTISDILTKKKLTLSVAESCTGGLLSHSLTNIPGSSKYFICGVVAYSNETKIKVLNVAHDTLKEHGAVSKETALALANNIRHITGTNIGIGITGIAGPGGGSALKPVGTVFIAVAIGHHMYFKKFRFSGNRLKIKSQAKDAALNLLKECLT
ncbi:MAG TPA: competence protein ComA [Candidatus Omnitrophica bacterium]|nr:competence protein ComA [Candidatus Omnitrophota bacterium]